MLWFKWSLHLDPLIYSFLSFFDHKEIKVSELKGITWLRMAESDPSNI